ncbi:GlxA family transcriptional regulator [Labrys wisconsinensis]|uniref:AraC family carnitine catabolism transcriptional activator n=1 Tax=Labrys wisconsinensis TaxID=425677 RepID=A0ABU0JJN8_9HYPH|nr:helix-turn-helix domain-containing protein [Labrys wisconsinensis]MDQ0474500.1 AraC family carnitine catabolism transcriptional activator [Labrys wisconsinensis]
MDARGEAGAGTGEIAVPAFNLIMQPEFPLNALVLASEALRIANQNSGRELFRWRFVSEDGAPVRASNGLWMSADDSLQTMPPADFYLVFEGNLPVQRNSPKLLNQLRTVARFGAAIGAVDTGTFALAQAGLVDSRAVVLHWEAVPTFRERFPQIDVQGQIYRIDGQRITCAGGIATLDMMLDLIARLKSRTLANEVANALVYAPRPAEAQQRLDDRPKPARRTLADRIVALMERNLDFPLPLEDIAGQLEVSPKTILRECRRSFEETPMRLYLRIRLQASRNMLFYEEFGIKDVATACGFSYPSVFSRAFHAQFGMTPRDFRASLRRQQNQAYRPEVRRLSITPPAPGAGADGASTTPGLSIDANSKSILIKSDRETGSL